jgi:tRNA threonylcarbamoyladenosine biosynthesis protein TsaE
VHVDAYRLGDAAELDDLDLDTDLDEAVTVVEWGEGVAEGLTDTRLEVNLVRSSGEDDETRLVQISPLGERWRGVGLAAALA